jgi:prolyl-tRNA synthetase
VYPAPLVASVMLDRWDTAGPELFRLQDRYKQDYCLGPVSHNHRISKKKKKNQKIKKS